MTTPSQKERSRKQRQPSVNDILKAAYRRHLRDRETRMAVKHCLG